MKSEKNADYWRGWEEGRAALRLDMFFQDSVLTKENEPPRLFNLFSPVAYKLRGGLGGICNGMVAGRTAKK